MIIPRNLNPPLVLPDKKVLTDAFWADVRDGAFSLAGATSMMKGDPQLRVEEECRKMSKKAVADGADDEFCKILSLIYMGFFWEGMAAVKELPMPQLGKKA